MKYFKLIGDSLSHSISPEIHNYTNNLLQLDAKYELFECDKNTMIDFLSSLKQNHKPYLNDCDGMNVTIPYKKIVIDLLDELDEHSKEIGAVNTIKIKNNKLYGYNTDYYGIEQSLDKSIVLDNNHLILGSGGACKPALHYLINNGAKKVFVASRTPKDVRLKISAKNKNKIEIVNYDFIGNISGTYIINSTPVGMFPNINSSPINESIFENFTHAFDLIYNPIETLFLKHAKKYGLSTQNGLKMLVFQALKSIEIWNDTTISDILKKDIYDYFKLYVSAEIVPNIYLVGITGVGKTSIGKIIANRLGYKFIDLDKEIERISGMTIPNIFAEGENVFRKIETDVLLSTAKMSRSIISTGGGAVTIEKNRNFLKDKCVIYLNRDINEIFKTIDTKNRPLLDDSLKNLKSLYNERKQYYEEVASYKVNNENLYSSIEEIMNIIKNTLI